MNRSPGDTSRRRALADVASAFPARASVVLYACVPPGQKLDDIVMRLRRHVEARDWVVVGEVFDHTPTATPLEHRPNWAQAQAYITTGQATGIVTTSRTACAQTSESSSLVQWLHDQHAFLSEESPTEAGAAR
ncbi:hypothetical protein ABT298_33230 [Streptomyces sp. NPDC001034]|uniref:hypothetical protein n=1 Tax=Streptomyces sp. NPDC001034 TaxID=3154375 RepID=UPI00332391B4